MGGSCKVTLKVLGFDMSSSCIGTLGICLWSVSDSAPKWVDASNAAGSLLVAAFSAPCKHPMPQQCYFIQYAWATAQETDADEDMYGADKQKYVGVSKSSCRAYGWACESRQCSEQYRNETTCQSSPTAPPGACTAGCCCLSSLEAGLHDLVTVVCCLTRFSLATRCVVQCPCLLIHSCIRVLRVHAYSASLCLKADPRMSAKLEGLVQLLRWYRK